MKSTSISLRLGAALAAFAFILSGCGAKKTGENAQGADVTGLEIPTITMEFDGQGGLPQFVEPGDDDDVALIVTEKGNILLRFCPKGAPKAVENFVTHAKNGYYDGVGFHRTIENFMIQGGDPEGTGMGGESIWGKGFAFETTDDLYHFRGALCMAHSQLPDSNGSQFYIVQAGALGEAEMEMAGADGVNRTQAALDKYREVGGYPWLDGGYTVFGQVLGGMDAVDAIAGSEVSDSNGTAVNPVKMEKVVILKYKDAKANQKPAAQSAAQ